MNLTPRIAPLQSFCYALALGLSIALIACSSGASASATSASSPASTEADNPAWLNELIQELKAAEPTNPPAKIYSYTYDYQTVYYLTGHCCDFPSKLYDARGNLYCEPDGGITGKGDGRCSDFLERRENEKLIWEDKRESN
ncbi:DUF6970 domain-containing protein [Pontibacter rugosus]|uniref:DUF6970 domain-containing protein n=1 Tax=Pontibacter rugosus TaxID=1745966 RepID=A0ABW3SKS1_9BACT